MTLLEQARQNRINAIAARKSREGNIFAENFGAWRRDRPGAR